MNRYPRTSRFDRLSCARPRGDDRSSRLDRGEECSGARDRHPGVMRMEAVLPEGRSGARTRTWTRGRWASKKRSCCSSATARRPGARRTCCARCPTSSSSTRAARRTGSRSSWPPIRTRPSARPPPSCAAARGAGSTVRGLGLRAAVAGTHPLVRAEDVQVSPGARYQYLHSSLRELARREPTFALHVHVAVPDAELAVRAYNGMRAHIPVLLALAANSPFTRGRDSGLASARTPVFRPSPHRHPARVRHLRRLRRGHRRPDPLRRDPRADVHLVGRPPAAEARHARGARDGRADAHPRHRRAGRAGAVPGADRGVDGMAEAELVHADEVIDENRFLAARDGINAQLLDPSAIAACPPRGAWRRSSTPAGRTPARSAASASWGCSRTSRATRARCASAPSPPSAAASPASCAASQAEFSPPRPQLALAAQHRLRRSALDTAVGWRAGDGVEHRIPSGERVLHTGLRTLLPRERGLR